MTLAQDVIVIVENDPCGQVNMKLSGQCLELIAHKILVTGRLQQPMPAMNRGNNKVPGIIEVYVRWMMVRHGTMRRTTAIWI